MQWMSPSVLLRKRMCQVKHLVEGGEKWTQGELQQYDNKNINKKNFIKKNSFAQYLLLCVLVGTSI